MKSIILSLFVLLSVQFTCIAQSEKNYAPVLKMAGSSMNLTTEKKFVTFKKQLSDAGFKDITSEIKPSIKNICIMEGKSKSATITYEIYYLEDDRIYELIMNIDSDKEKRFSTEVTMQVQKIAFNNVCNALYKELGSTNISIMDFEAPYSREDWDDDKIAAEALKSGKLFIMFGYASEKYKGTKYENEPSVYVSLDPFMRVRMGVKDVELFKLAKQN